MNMSRNTNLAFRKVSAEILLTALFFVGLIWCGTAAAQKVRIAMPAKSMTFLNFYVGDKFGIYKAEGLDVSLDRKSVV